MITINDLKKEMETICGKWESMGVNPNESLYEFLRFVQPWSSTALGFGGIGGQAFTSAITTRVFEEFGIDLCMSGTGMYSSWHKAIMDKYNVHLMTTSDIGSFIKFGNKVFKVSHGDYNRFYDYFKMLAEMYNKNEINKSDIQNEINDIITGKSGAIDIYLEPCQDLESFENDIRGMSSDNSVFTKKK